MLKGKEGEANKGTNSREKSQPDEATVTLKHLNERSQVSEQGATFLTLSLQIGRAAQGTWSQVQGSERSQKYCPSYQVGKGKAVSLSIAPWHLGNGQAGLWLHLTHQPQHLSKGGREGGQQQWVFQSQLQLRAVVPKGEQIALLQGSGEHCGSPSILQWHPTAIPAHLSHACWQHQPEPGSFSLTSRVTIPGWDEKILLPPSVVYEDAKSSLRLVVLFFQGRKKNRLTLIPAGDCSYSSHTGVNILALGKEKNKQGDIHLFLPPINVNPNFSDLMST